MSVLESGLTCQAIWFSFKDNYFRKALNLRFFGIILCQLSYILKINI